MKYSQCPGPHEKVTLAFSHPYLVAAPEKEREEGDGKMASMMFKLTKAVPKNGQLNMMYASSEKEVDGFFAERGLTRCDVWTKVIISRCLVLVV